MKSADFFSGRPAYTAQGISVSKLCRTGPSNTSWTADPKGLPLQQYRTARDNHAIRTGRTSPLVLNHTVICALLAIIYGVIAMRDCAVLYRTASIHLRVPYRTLRYYPPRYCRHSICPARSALYVRENHHYIRVDESDIRRDSTLSKLLSTKVAMKRYRLKHGIHHDLGAPLGAPLSRVILKPLF